MVGVRNHALDCLFAAPRTNVRRARLWIGANTRYEREPGYTKPDGPRATVSAPCTCTAPKFKSTLLDIG
jgi:hypothetical protein